MVSRVTIVWTAATDGDRESFEDATRQIEGLTVTKSTPTALPTCIPVETRMGAVVVVTASSRDATRALELGADEVLRAGDVTPDRLRAAIDLAVTRAQARTAQRHGAGSVDVDGSAFTLFAQAMSRELAQPLHAARMNLTHLADAIPTVSEVADRLVGWAALVGGTEELRNLVALRATAAPSTDLRDTLDDVQICLDALDRTLTAFRAVAANEARSVTDAGEQLAAVLDLVRGQLQQWAEVRTEAAEPGLIVGCTPTFLSWVVGTMLGRAVLVLRASKRRGIVALRAFQREGVVVLEVEATATETAEELAGVAGVPDAGARAGRDLEAIRTALREIGGELLIDADPAWLLARAFLPMAAPDAVVEVPRPSNRPRSRTSN